MQGPKKYCFFDEDCLIGTYTAAEAAEIFGVAKYSVGKYAYSGKRIKGKYRIEREEPEKQIRSWDVRTDWPKEWEEAVAVLRSVIDTEKYLMAVWDAAVQPFHRRRSDIWKATK